MAGQNQISVNIVAQVAGFKAAMAEAQESTKKFSETIRSSFEKLQAPVEKFNSILATIGAVAAGAAFKEIVNSTVEATEATKKLAVTFGTNLQAASELRVELATLGVETDEYTGIAARLDRQVKDNAASLQRHGLVIKDSNGQLLSQSQIMQNAVSWLKEFRAGTDRNNASLFLFGRNISEVGKLMAVVKAENRERAAGDTAALGLGITPADIERTEQYKIAIGQLSISFEGIKRAIGDAVLPYLTRFAEFFRAEAPSIISGVKNNIGGVINSMITFGEAIGNIIIATLKALDDLGAGFDKLKIRAAAALTGGAIGAVLGAVSPIPGGAAIGGAIGSGIGWAAGGQGSGSSFDERFTGEGTGFAKAQQELKDFADRMRALSASVNSGRWGGRANRLAASSGEQEILGEGTRSAEGLSRGDDKKADEIAKLRQERAKMVADYELQVEDTKNKELLDLGKLTEKQFLELHLDNLQKKAAADEAALTKERDVFQKGSVEWERAENARVKGTEKANEGIEDANHKLVLEMQKDFKALGDSINSSLTSSIAKAFEQIGAKTHDLRAVFQSFLKSLQSDFANFAAKQLVEKAIGGALSGPTGQAGGIGGLIAQLFSGGGLSGHAVGGTVAPGQWAIAGEMGPELIYGGRSGAAVTPNAAMSGGGGGVNNNFNINVSGATGNAEVMNMVRAGTNEAIRQSAKAVPGLIAAHRARFA